MNTDQAHSALSNLRDEITKRTPSTNRSTGIILISCCSLFALASTFGQIFIQFSNTKQKEKERTHLLTATRILPIYHPPAVFLHSLDDVVSVKSMVESENDDGNNNALKENHDTHSITFHQSSTSVDQSKTHKHKHSSTKNKTSHKCELMSPEWQAKPYPTCNSIHEFDLVHSLYTPDLPTSSHKENSMTKIVGIGGKRIAWVMAYSNRDEQIIFKTSTWDKNVTRETIHNNQRDAIATDKLSFSSHVMPMYGYCSIAVLNEKGYEGADSFFLHHKQRHNLTPTEKLYFAKNAARGISDVHSVVNERGDSAMVHGDVRPWNFMIVSDKKKKKDIKVHDFNAVRFRGYYNDTGVVCQSQSYNCNRNKPVEQCIEGSAQTEKIDVHGLGNFIFFLLTFNLPYYTYGLSKRLRIELVKRGYKPRLSKELTNSTDPAIIVMRDMMFKCIEFHAEDRPSANEVADAFEKVYSENIV